MRSWFTAADFCQAQGIARKTFRRMLSAGLPHFALGDQVLIREEAFLQWIEKNESTLSGGPAARTTCDTLTISADGVKSAVEQLTSEPPAQRRRSSKKNSPGRLHPPNRVE